MENLDTINEDIKAIVKIEDMETAVNPYTGNTIDIKKLLSEQKLAVAYIDTNFPFFTKLLKNLTWIYTWDINTQATDGTRLLVNPEFTASLSFEMKAFVMMHEAMHCALDHLPRTIQHGFDDEKGNIAGDYEINALLVDRKVAPASEVKATGLYDPKYLGKSFEVIYAECPNSPGKQSMTGAGSRSGSGPGQAGQSRPGSRQSGQSGQPGQAGQSGQSGQSDQSGQSGQGAAVVAQVAAAVAQEAADAAAKSGNKDAAKKAQKAADAAKKAAEAAQKAADAGDDKKAAEQAKKAFDAANEAAKAAEDATGGESTGEEKNLDSIAEAAQRSATEAIQHAQNAELSGDKAAAKKAQQAAKKAQQAAQEAAEAASEGDADKALQKALEAAKAASEARAAAESARSNDGEQDTNKVTGKKLSQKELDEIKASNTASGGFVSQEVGAAIAKRAGYDGDDVKVKSATQLSREWEKISIDAASTDAGGHGAGNAIRNAILGVYKTSIDWKYELRKYIGRALSRVEDDQRMGKRRWLAMGEIKKYDIHSESDLDDVVFMLDMSGSMDDKRIGIIMEECFAICKQKKIEKVTYAYYDDGIRNIESNISIKKPEDAQYAISKLKGTKGTGGVGAGANNENHAMEDLKTFLTKNHKKPQLVIWLTDGWIPETAPVKPRNLIKNMIWVIYDNLDFDRLVSDSSTVIHIKLDDVK